MSGHSKWANIKHRKGAKDAKKGKIFSRIIKEITVAAREGGPDPEANSRLRVAVQNAKGQNMPKDHIERAIKKATGADADSFDEYTFEGYGSHGIAIFVECLTDNHNRLVSSMRSIFNKYGGTLGTNGSLNFLFERKGIFILHAWKINLEELELDLIDAGAEEFEEGEQILTVTCALEDFGHLNKKLDELGMEVISAQLQRVPNDTKALDVEKSKKVLMLIEALEENDDVQHVFHNLEMTAELQKVLEAE